MLITVVPDTQEDAISDYISSTSSFFTPPPLRHWKHETEIEKREAKSDQVTVHCWGINRPRQMQTKKKNAWNMCESNAC